MIDDREFDYLATTNPGLESVACREVRELVGADAERVYRGAIGFSASATAIHELNRWARGLHRILVVLVDSRIDSLGDVEAATREVAFEEYIDQGQSFGVESTRHGEHDFTSPEVADRVGQAVVDRLREATGERIPVDLDDPDQVLRSFVRDDRYLLGVDTTGERSLHRRPYRVCEHDAPLRSTFAYQMLRLAGFEPGDSLLDPMCGSATVPTEAALYAAGRPPDPDRGYAFERLPFVDAPGRGVDPAPVDQGTGDSAGGDGGTRPVPGSFTGVDSRDRWVRCGRENVAAADLAEAVTVREGDATELAMDADVVVTNPPYGIRTPEDLQDLYRGFSERLREGSFRRAALVTTSPGLLDVPVERRIDVKFGRLDASVVVVRGS